MGVKGILTLVTEPDMFMVKYLCLSVSSWGSIFSCFCHYMLCLDTSTDCHWHYLPILKNLVDSLKELALIVKSYCWYGNGIYIEEIIGQLEIRILKEE